MRPPARPRVDLSYVAASRCTGWSGECAGGGSDAAARAEKEGGGGESAGGGGGGGR